MQSTTASRPFTIASLLNIRRVAVCWMVGGVVLMLGGCVSQQRYEGARQEANTRANELAQVQAEIQILEQQRDAAHAANQRDERTLGNLKSELQNIRASFDQIRKSNHAKLAALQHSLTALRSRHQAMLKEISETKRYEKKLEALTAQHEQAMATMPAGPEAHVTTVDSLQQESRMVAVITPSTLKPEEPSASAPPTAAPSPPDIPAATDLSPSTATPQATSTVAAAPVPASVPARTEPVSATTASPTTSTPPAPQNESWFSSMTGWLASMFVWLWS